MRERLQEAGRALSDLLARPKPYTSVDAARARAAGKSEAMGHTETAKHAPRKRKSGRIPREAPAGDQVVTFRLDEATHAAIRGMAIEEDRTMGYLFRLAIREFVERRQKPAEEHA